MASRALELPVHGVTRFVLCRPHYPENVGAAARAIKTMGFSRLALVRPGRLAQPDHEMAIKMAVKSRDVLDAATVHDSLADALASTDLVFATTSRRGVSGVLQPREVAAQAPGHAARGRTLAFVFGNEKTGLSQAELALCHERVRVPMAADQPSINLAQAVQLVAYELFVAALQVQAEYKRPRT